MKRIPGFIAVLALVHAWPAAAQEAEGMAVVRSAHTATVTVERVRAAVEGRGLAVFSVVDHAANAAGAGLELGPTVLILFGNPSVGTPLMRSARTVAIDLPQKMLVWRDEEGVVRVGYNEPSYLDRRHGLGACAAIVERVGGALRAIAEEAAR